MHPIKHHRIVRQGAAMVASGSDGRNAVIESAADETRPERPHPMAMCHVGRDALSALPDFQPAMMRAGEQFALDEQLALDDFHPSSCLRASVQLAANQGSTMLISLYSGMAAWVVVPQRVRPTNAAAIHGPLIFEGTIHSHLLSTDIWSRIWSEWDQHSYANLSEDLGLVLLGACLDRYGTLTPPFTEALAAPS